MVCQYVWNIKTRSGNCKSKNLWTFRARNDSNQSAKQEVPWVFRGFSNELIKLEVTNKMIFFSVHIILKDWVDQGSVLETTNVQASFDHLLMKFIRVDSCVFVVPTAELKIISLLLQIIFATASLIFSRLFFLTASAAVGREILKWAYKPHNPLAMNIL